MRHAFRDSGETRADKGGRMLRVCAECGRVKVGTAHSVTDGSVPIPVLPKRDPKPQPVPREIKMLALALEAALDLPMDTLGWSLALRAIDLRKAIPLPFDERSRAFDEKVTEAPKQQPPIDLSSLPVERLSGPVRARAKAATKSIRDPRMREIATRAVATGWTLRRTAGHFQLIRGRERITFAHTPGDNRAWLNMKALAKRHGIDVTDL